MNYHNITKDDMLNGDGLRTVLWTSGCNHGCQGCQNCQTWNPKSGIKFDKAAKEELLLSLEFDSNTGITFSGGDPLFPSNRETVLELMKEIKEKFPDKTIWSYTGYRYEDVKDLPHMQYIDVLVDGEYEQDKRDVTLYWKGSSNQRVIDVKATRLLEKCGMLKEGEVYLHCGDHTLNPTECNRKELNEFLNMPVTKSILEGSSNTESYAEIFNNERYKQCSNETFEIGDR